MTPSLNSALIRGVLLDIEGTTTPISFVHEVLFSYARANLKNYLTAHIDSSETRADLARLSKENSADLAAKLNPPTLVNAPRDALIESVVAYVNWLIDRDRKSTALKEMQGKIWKQGYLDGNLKAELFDDVPGAFKRWRTAGLSINIFSSGSVLAQQLLFGHTRAGDVSDFIDNYFDTTTGSKTEVESYRLIALSLRLTPREILFISDVVAELDAASAAGMQTLLCLRPGNAPVHDGEKHRSANDFDGLLI